MTAIPVLRVEPGVKFDGIAPAGARIIAALDGATKVLGFDLWISSGTEGHGPTSSHTTGEAYDVPVKDMSCIRRRIRSTDSMHENAIVLSRSPLDESKGSLLRRSGAPNGWSMARRV